MSPLAPAAGSSSAVDRRWWRRRGRVLAVKWGYNPNSSSLGVDVTFLLFGLSIITLLTPLLGLFLRFAAQRRQGSGGTAD